MATLVAALTLAAAPARAQWTDHFAYSECSLSAVASGVPVCGNSYSLFYYDASEGYTGRLNKVNHLSAVGMSAIAANGSQLIVGYSDGNIDVVDMANLTTVNIPEFQLSESVTNKAINDICVSGGMAYIATTGGVLELNLAKSEVRSFWRVVSGGVSANAIAVSDGRIFVGTTQGIYTAPLSSRLLEDYSQWTLLTSPTGNVASMTTFNGAVYAGIGTAGQNCPVWKIAGDLSATQVFTASGFRSLSAADKYMVVTQGWKVAALDKDLKEVAVLTGIKSSASAESNDVVSSANFRSAHLIDGATIAIADYNAGLIIADFNSVGKAIKPDGPYANVSEDFHSKGADLYVAGPGYLRGSANNRATLSVLHDGSWITNSTTSYATQYFAEDPVSGQLYVSTFGSGVFMIDDDFKFGKQFYSNNSPLSPAFSNVVRTDAITVDKNQNLVVLNNSVVDGLKVMDKDSTWYSYSYGPMSNTNSAFSMTCTSNGNIWLLSLSRYLCVFNINGTPETDDDDLYMTNSGAVTSDPQYVGTFSLTDASSGEAVGTYARSVAESADGAIWVGTTAGLLVTTDNATMLQTGSVTFNRIKVPRNDGTNLADYLLDGQFVLDIEVDGADRKWIATDNGVYLVSPDGLTTIHHFTAANSPLPSDMVYDICIRESDGEVFIQTQGGLVSRRGDAITPAKTLTKIKIYPNPVSATGLSGVDYVTMTGFEDASPIVITDVAGNRVYRTTSLGGMARWDMRREGGGRVASGVYIVWATNSDGSNSAVGKILVKE